MTLFKYTLHGLLILYRIKTHISARTREFVAHSPLKMTQLFIMQNEPLDTRIPFYGQQVSDFMPREKRSRASWSFAFGTLDSLRFCNVRPKSERVRPYSVQHLFAHIWKKKRRNRRPTKWTVFRRGTQIRRQAIRFVRLFRPGTAPRSMFIYENSFNLQRARLDCAPVFFCLARLKCEYFFLFIPDRARSRVYLATGSFHFFKIDFRYTDLIKSPGLKLWETYCKKKCKKIGSSEIRECELFSYESRKGSRWLNSVNRRDTKSRPNKAIKRVWFWLNEFLIETPVPTLFFLT